MPIDTFPITFVNGQPENTIAVSDRGLSYGDGVFETILVVRGEIPLWAAHHERLLKGLVALKITIESQRIRQAVDIVLEQAKQCSDELFVLKVIVTRGQGGRGYQVDPSAQSTLITQLFPLDIDATKYNGISVHLCRQKLMPVEWAGLKTLNQLPYVLAAQERLNTAFDEGLLFSFSGELVEATSRNIFIVKDEKLMTPRINEYGVAGVMRQTIMDNIAAQIGVKVIEASLIEEDLFSADEVFLVNSITGIWPVIECEKKRWAVGPITRSLQAMCHGAFVGNI